MFHFEKCIVISAVGVLGIGCVLLISHLNNRKKKEYPQGLIGLVGNTPLIEIPVLSKDTGCVVLGKCEFLNPGGSVKDRVALNILAAARREGHLPIHGKVYEGSSGSTGISLALIGHAMQVTCCVSMPNDQATEKEATLLAVGAETETSSPVSIVDEEHFCNRAKNKARTEGGMYANQFENLDNFRAHYHTTGKEILEQCPEVDCLVASAGTGGTISGCAARIKGRNPHCKVILADTHGSALAGKINWGVLYCPLDNEAQRQKHIFDTITEGIGLNRLTANFSIGAKLIDVAISVSDQEAVDMSHYLLTNEGLFLGSSSCVNLVAVVKAVKRGILPPNSTIVTILCDSGFRHLSKFHNPTYLQKNNLQTQDPSHPSKYHSANEFCQ
eukprot:Platyproteum_vivax@DN256_c0_g1_i1.p1